MQMAATRPSQADRALLLQQSQAELENARALEAACVLSSQGAKPRGIPPPQIVTRTSNSVTIRPGGAFTLRARSGKVPGGRQSAEEKPAAYAVFGKVAGSGVAVSLHNTDFPGTGGFQGFRRVWSVVRSDASGELTKQLFVMLWLHRFYYFEEASFSFDFFFDFIFLFERETWDRIQDALK
jgi:hypothetical protein